MIRLIAILIVPFILFGQQNNADSELDTINNILTKIFLTQQAVDILLTPYAVNLGAKENNKFAESFADNYTKMYLYGALLITTEYIILNKIKKKHPKIYSIAISLLINRFFQVLAKNFLAIIVYH